MILPMKTSKHYALFVVLFTIFLDMLGIGILFPVIPELVANPASPHYLLPVGWTLNSGYLLLGFLSAAYPFAQFLTSPILGQMSDRYGRKKILALCLAGTGVSYVLFAIGIITRNIPLLIGSRVFNGLTGGNIAVAQAVLADVSKPEDRAKTFGLMGAVFGLGFILGPFLGAKLSDPSLVSWFNAATPFWIAAVLSVLNVTSVLYFLPETHPGIKHGLAIKWAKSIHNIVGAFRFKSLRTLFGTTFLFSGGFSFFTTLISVYLISKFAFDQGGIGNFFAYIGLWIIITQGLITRLVARKLKEHQVLKFSLIGSGTGVLLHLLPSVGWAIFLVSPVLSIFNGLSMANLSGLISRSADAEIQGEVLGINVSLSSLATAFAPVIAGGLAATFGPATCLIVSGVIIILAGIWFNLMYTPALVNKVAHQHIEV